MYAVVALGALLSTQTQAPATTGSPTQTVSGFIEALNAGDVKGAWAFVLGSKYTYPARTLQNIFQTVAKERKASFQLFEVKSIGEPSNGTDGEVSVPVTVAMGPDAPVQEKVRLKTVGGRWLILPPTERLQEKGQLVTAFSLAAAQPVAMLAILTPILYRGAGRQPEEGREMAACSSLLLTHAVSNGDVLPKTFADLRKGPLMLTPPPGSNAPNPLIPLVEKAVRMAAENRWAINENVAGKNLNDLKDPFHTVLVYEAGPQGLNYRFAGKALVVLATGVTRLVNETEAYKLRWMP